MKNNTNAKTFAKWILEGVNYDKSSDFFVLSPSKIEILLQVAGFKKNIQDLAKEKRFNG